MPSDSFTLQSTAPHHTWRPTLWTRLLQGPPSLSNLSPLPVLRGSVPHSCNRYPPQTLLGQITRSQNRLFRTNRVSRRLLRNLQQTPTHRHNCPLPPHPMIPRLLLRLHLNYQQHPLQKKAQSDNLPSPRRTVLPTVSSIFNLGAFRRSG